MYTKCRENNKIDKKASIFVCVFVFIEYRFIYKSFKKKKKCRSIKCKYAK